MSKTKRKACEHWVTHVVPDFDKSFVQNVQKSLANREFHDFTITNEAGNIEIPVHRIVIATRISALKDKLLDKEISSMKIDLDEELLKALVNYCYTGTLKIDQETQLLPLYKLCTINRINNFQTFFVDQFDDFITPQKVMDILEEYQSSNTGIQYKLIQEKCLKVILNNITTIANKPNFANISVLNFGKLLRRDDFALQSEEKILEIFLKWYYKQPDFTLNSSPICPSRIIPNGKNVLLSVIRLPLIESKYVKKYAEKIWLIHDANDLLAECKQRSTQKSFDVAAESDNFRMQPRVAQRLNLLAIGIREMNESFHMELLDARGEKWRTLPSIKYPNKNKHLFRRNCVYALYTDKENMQNIMIIGGENCRELKKVESINVRTMQLKQMASIQIPRQNHSVALIDKYIYIAGGISGGKVLASVEEYNLTTNEWKLVTPMLTARAGCQLIAFEDTIYALGGFNKDSCLNSVEYFDRNENSWVATTPMLEVRYDFAATVYRNRIYVLGGNSEIARNYGNIESELDSVEYFNANSKTWTRIASLNRKRDHLSAVVYQNQLMAIAGFDTNAKTQNMVEEYDEDMDEWIELCSLNACTGRMGVFVLSSFD